MWWRVIICSLIFACCYVCLRAFVYTCLYVLICSCFNLLVFVVVCLFCFSWWLLLLCWSCLAFVSLLSAASSWIEVPRLYLCWRLTFCSLTSFPETLFDITDKIYENIQDPEEKIRILQKTFKFSRCQRPCRSSQASQRLLLLSEDFWFFPGNTNETTSCNLYRCRIQCSQ